MDVPSSANTSESFPGWLAIARRLQAIAQTGLHFTQDDFDRERYQSIRSIAASIVNHHETAGPDKEPAQDIWRRETGYGTPKIGVRSAVFRDNKILLVRERFDGLWSLPGGWCDVGLTPSANAEKEVLEEAGLRVKAERLIALFDEHAHPHVRSHLFQVYMLLFMCRTQDDTALPQPGLETTDVNFFAEDSLPPLSLSRVTPGQIAWCFACHRDPQLPVKFD